MKHFRNGFVIDEEECNNLQFVLKDNKGRKVIVSSNWLSGRLSERENEFTIIAVFIRTINRRKIYIENDRPSEYGVGEGKNYSGFFVKVERGREVDFVWRSLEGTQKIEKEMARKGYILKRIDSYGNIPEKRRMYQSRLKKVAEKIREFMKAGMERKIAIMAARACACSH